MNYIDQSSSPAPIRSFSYIIQDSAVTVFFAATGEDRALNASEPGFKEVVAALKDPATTDDILLPLFVSQQAAATVLATLDGLTVDGSGISYLGTLLPDRATRRICELMAEGHESGPLLKFLHKLMQNPKEDIFLELFDFMSVSGLPITAEGDFIAYKIVRDNYLDIYSGTMDNTPGKPVTMPPALVDSDRNRTCSRGLHVCSKSYLPHYGSAINGSDRIVICRIDPRHVMAIPTDYNFAKMRVSQYMVIGEMTEKGRTDVIEKRAVFHPTAVTEAADLYRDESGEDDYNYGDYDDKYETSAEDTLGQVDNTVATTDVPNDSVFYVQDDYSPDTYYLAQARDIRAGATLYTKDEYGDFAPVN